MRIHPVPTIPNTANFALHGEDLHHLVRVLRARPGERWILQDPEGNRVLARIEAVGRQAIEMAIVRPLAPFPKKAAPLWLAAALPKGKGLQTLLRGCTEAGVDRILPVVFARSESRADIDLERGRRVIHEAVKQCGLPEQVVLEEGRLLEDLPRPPRAHVVVLDHGAGEEGTAPWIDLSREVPVDRPWLLVVGPEGGFTGEEREILQANGAITAHLGPTVYRIETAAIVACAIGAARLYGR